LVGPVCLVGPAAILPLPVSQQQFGNFPPGVQQLFPVIWPALFQALFQVIWLAARLVVWLMARV